ncbi:MAG: hypothetical protein ACK55Z_09200 [bacterium]
MFGLQNSTGMQLLGQAQSKRLSMSQAPHSQQYATSHSVSFKPTV